MIGESLSSCYTQLHPNIYVKAHKAIPLYTNYIKSALCAIQNTKIGYRLLEKIASTPHLIKIKYSKCIDSTRSVGANVFKKGVGAPCTISFNGASSNYLTCELKSLTYPYYISLFHELVHAYHSVRGSLSKDSLLVDPIVWTDTEEYHTIVGFPSKNPHRVRPKITENALLEEVGLPLRFSHHTIDVIHENPLNYARVKKEASLLLKLNHRGFLPPPLKKCTIDDLDGPYSAIFYYQYWKKGSTVLKEKKATIAEWTYIQGNQAFYEFDHRTVEICMKIETLFPKLAGKQVRVAFFYVIVISKSEYATLTEE